MPKLKYVSIISPQYSGSTLLCYSICTHAEACSLGEYNQFCRSMFLVKNAPFLCSCGEKLQQCEHWKRIKDHLLSHYSDKLLKLNFSYFQFFESEKINSFYRKLIMHMHFKRFINKTPAWLIARYHQITNMNVSIVEKEAELTNSRCFVDTSKSIDNCIYLSCNKKIDSYAIQLTRDGRAQMWSALRQARKHNRIRSAEDAATRWKSITLKQTRILNLLDIPILKVRYEDFCSNPVKCLSRIQSFIDVSSRKVTNKTEFLPVEHAFGNFNTTFSGVKNITDKQEWKNHLTKNDLEIFEKNAGALNKQLGYE